MCKYKCSQNLLSGSPWIYIDVNIESVRTSFKLKMSQVIFVILKKNHVPLTQPGFIVFQSVNSFETETVPSTQPVFSVFQNGNSFETDTVSLTQPGFSVFQSVNSFETDTFSLTQPRFKSIPKCQ